MIICEYGFEAEDSNNPGYSILEVDYYAWIPSAMRKTMPNHRLSLRKNLKTNEYEVYRHFVRAIQGMLILGGKFTPKVRTHISARTQDEIAFKSKSLQDAVSFANSKWNKYHATKDYKRMDDEVCIHKPPVLHWMCRKFYGDNKNDVAKKD